MDISNFLRDDASIPAATKPTQHGLDLCFGLASQHPLLCWLDGESPGFEQGLLLLTTHSVWGAPHIPNTYYTVSRTCSASITHVRSTSSDTHQ